MIEGILRAMSLIVCSIVIFLKYDNLGKNIIEFSKYDSLRVNRNKNYNYTLNDAINKMGYKVIPFWPILDNEMSDLSDGIGCKYQPVCSLG